MPTTITAKVARTAKGLSHVNLLKMPGFGVEWLRLIAAGGGKSNSYLPTGFSSLTDSSDYFCFAPGVASDQVTISYKIGDPSGQISKGRLELFRAQEDTPFWTLPLMGDSLTDGEHKDLTWDGGLKRDAVDNKWGAATLVKPAEFADKHLTTPDNPYLTIGSPYKLKLTVEGAAPGMPAVAWTYLHILVADIELKLGDKKLLTEPLDKDLWDSLQKPESLDGNLPAPAKTKQVFLDSNLFKTSPGEMNDNTAFTEYQTKWGNGPSIPILAKIRILSSSGSPTEAAKALGSVHFLWDWTSLPEDMDRLKNPKGVACVNLQNYIKQSVDYYINDPKTGAKPDPLKPEGSQNSHADHGGKRGGTFVFPQAAGYSPQKPLQNNRFPFKVEPCVTRQWSAFSYAWTSGELEGHTGVLFQPSRMAGDSYCLSIYVAYEKNPKDTAKWKMDALDKTPLASPALTKATGAFLIQREVHLAKYVKKSINCQEYDLAVVQAFYKHAHIRLQTLYGSVEVMTQVDYDAKISTVIASQPPTVASAVMPGISQFTGQADVTAAATDYAVTFRPYSDWVNAIIANRKAVLLAAGTGLSDVQAGAQATIDMNNALTSGGLASESAYKKKCGDWGDNIAKSVCCSYVETSKQGVTVVHFDCSNNFGRVGLLGVAVGCTSADRNHCVFLSCQARGLYPGCPPNDPLTDDTLEKTIAHELGHHLFLPHSPWGNPNPGGAQANRHDLSPGGEECMMTYNRGDLHFCGLCVLRLRGWSADTLISKGVIGLNSNGSKNQKP